MTLEMILTTFLVATLVFMITAIIVERRNLKKLMELQETADKIFVGVQVYDTHFDNIYKTITPFNRLDYLQKSQDSVYKLLESINERIDSTVSVKEEKSLKASDVLAEPLKNKIIDYLIENKNVRTSQILQHLENNKGYRPKSHKYGLCIVNQSLHSLLKKGYVSKNRKVGQGIRWNLLTNPQKRAA